MYIWEEVGERFFHRLTLAAIVKLHSVDMKIFVLFVVLFCLTSQAKLLAQHKLDTFYFFSDTCHWDSIGGKKTTLLKNKKGFVYNRFGITIININGIAYNPCNIPPNLIGKTILFSGVIFKNIKTDGKAIRITNLQVIPDD